MMLTNTIKLAHCSGRISLLEGDKEVAFITFELEGDDALLATHTIVSPDYQGQGLARQLVDLLIKWAGEHQRRIVPICSYVRRLDEQGYLTQPK